jgi:hypothetical protein
MEVVSLPLLQGWLDERKCIWPGSVQRIANGYNFSNTRQLLSALRDTQQAFERTTDSRIDPKLIESEYFERLAFSKRWGRF